MPDPARMPPPPRPATLAPAVRSGVSASADNAARPAARRWLAGATDLLTGWMGLKLEKGAMAGRSIPLAYRHAAVATPQARAFVQANDALVRQRVAARLMADFASRTQVPGSVNALIHLSEEHATAALRREPASPWTTRELTDGELDAIVELAARFAQRLMSARNTDEMQHILESDEL